MARIDYIVVHCSATRAGQHYTIKDIDNWHRKQGWKMVGYHYVIQLDGTIEKGRPDDMPGSHVLVKGQNYNSRSIGICYIGGLSVDGKTSEDTRTPAQKVALEQLIRELHAKHPNAEILGHRDLSPDLNRNGKVEPYEWLKACPSFDVRGWTKTLNL